MRDLKLTMADEEELAGLDLDPIRVVTAETFLRMDIPQRGKVLDPIIPEKGLAMIHSWRGVGKTHLALGIGYAVATGGAFLKWTAPKARKVLLIDGEMPAVALRDRLAAIIAGADSEPPDPEYLRIVSADLQDFSIPSLASIEGQLVLEADLEDAEFVIVDNISTLCSGLGRENESESWTPLQQWALSLRRRGISVLFIHHAGKGGAQRGTSRREDILDTVIALKRPADYDPNDGARFEIHLEKARSIHGPDADPFEVRMQTPNGAAVWTISDLKQRREAQVLDMLGIGMSIRDIADELKISRSQVHRIKGRVAR